MVFIFRLEALKHQVDALNQPVAWIKTRKLLYEKAFVSRCRSLKLAETEVSKILHKKAHKHTLC